MAAAVDVGAGEHQRAVGDGRVLELLEDVLLSRRHRAHVVDPVRDDRRDLRRVVEVDPLQGVSRVRGLARDHHVVVPDHLAFLRHDVLEVRVARGVGLEHVTRPCLADPGVTVLEVLDVALVVVTGHQRPLLGEPRRGLLPVAGSGRRGIDAECQHPGAAQLGVVVHHPDVALECGVRQVLEAGDRTIDHLAVVGDAGEAGLPHRGEAVARVVVGVLDRLRGVTGEVG